MKSTITLFIFQFLLLNSFSQTTFEKTFGGIDNDAGYYVDICPDGSYLACGYTTEFFYGFWDIFVIKIDQYGDTLWTKTIGSDSDFEWAYSIKSTFDGGFVICGNISGSACLLKFDASNNQEWVKVYNDIIPEGTAFDVIQTADSGYALCGDSKYSKSSTDLWGSKAFLLKTDQQGENEWLNLYGGYGGHSAHHLLQKEDGGFTICGNYDTQGEYEAAWLFTTNPNGGIIDDFKSGGVQNTEFAWDLKQCSDGGYVLCGTKYGGFLTMNGDIQLHKVDSNLNEEWARQYSSGEGDSGGGVDIVGNGGYILCGSTKGTASGYRDVWLIRTDFNGDTIWTNTYGGYYDDYAYSVKSTLDGGFIICGMTSNGMDDVYLIKTNTEGTLVWSNEYSIPGNRTKVFPNPGKGIYQIQSASAIDQIDLLNKDGQLIKQFDKTNLEKSAMSINIKDYPPGIYLLRLYSKQENNIFKIIKQ